MAAAPTPTDVAHVRRYLKATVAVAIGFDPVTPSEIAPLGQHQTTDEFVIDNELSAPHSCRGCGVPQSIANAAARDGSLSTLDWLARLACPLAAGLCTTRRRALSAVFRS